MSYIPLETGFRITSNRDELRSRPTSPPKVISTEHGMVLCPRDEMAGGTWIAAGDTGRVCCLLNGASKPYKRNPPYRKSRGLVVTESFAFEQVESFIGTYDFAGIEPFTMLMFVLKREAASVRGVSASQPQSLATIHEIRWDGSNLLYRLADPDQPGIWQSVTLYDEEARTKREAWFRHWLQEYSGRTDKHIEAFHHYRGSDRPEHDILMQRKELQTVSVTSVRVGPGLANMDYKDIISGEQHRASIPLLELK